MSHLKFFLFFLLLVNLLIGCKKECEIPTYENSFTLFEQPDIKGSKAEYTIATMLLENQLRVTKPDGSDDAASSVSYSLAPGIVVYLYENEDGSGTFTTLEGIGSKNLAEEGMDNIVSAVRFKVE